MMWFAVEITECNKDGDDLCSGRVHLQAQNIFDALSKAPKHYADEFTVNAKMNHLFATVTPEHDRDIFVAASK